MFTFVCSRRAINSLLAGSAAVQIACSSVLADMSKMHYNVLILIKNHKLTRYWVGDEKKFQSVCLK